MRALIALAATVATASGGALLPAAGPCADEVARWSTLTIGPPRVEVVCAAGPPGNSALAIAPDRAAPYLLLYSLDENYTAALQTAIGTTEPAAAARLLGAGIDHTLCIDHACVAAPELPCGPALAGGFSVCAPTAPEIDPPCFTGAHATCSELTAAGVSIAGGAVVGWLSVVVAPPKL